ncbi:putative N-(5 -phosphoribosyl)anthranilate isomerase [Megalodesulfovibrio gigas DSM 1382 = ATCC 19364]|uniref:N-(5'-phosphoribosyl)anthranilate isomerase n=2 Tax=Megalodesulfovibrio gigas TaxID=879 RepID=T2GER6_MEGG1|nr:putative N-(5 -phosphoribosyl)anthranilate isomerase [Megalodesulfovibrio gigas DSM 1382 = ATCC 19364]
MKPYTPPRLPHAFIQAAGVFDADEALRCFAAGVDVVGIPLRLNHHRPDLSEAAAAALVATVRARNPRLAFAVITYEDDACAAAGLCRAVGAQALQLHGDIAAEAGLRLRTLLPDVLLMKSLIVGLRDEAGLHDEMQRHAPWADAFLTDTFDPTSGAMGATGQIHDWTVSRRLVQQSPRPVILAGGLVPGNVAAAVAAVQPAGVDAHTGLEDAAGSKDWATLAAFAARARLAFAGLAR